MKSLWQRLFGAGRADPAPLPMMSERPATQAGYRKVLDAALARHRDQAATMLSKALDSLPEKTRAIDFGVVAPHVLQGDPAR